MRSYIKELELKKLKLAKKIKILKIVDKLDDKVENVLFRLIETHFGVTKEELESSSRKQSISQPRQVMMYILRDVYTLKEVGAILGGRDHTTVLHGYRNVRGFLDVDDEITTNMYNKLNEIFEEK